MQIRLNLIDIPLVVILKIISKKRNEKKKKKNPKYLLVLIWSFRSEVIKQELNYIKKGGN